MDPLAHTLFGAALAETGLGKLARRATPTLILGANLPDIDAFAPLVSADFSFGFRRGWTHGVLALAILPALLVGIMALLARRRDRDALTRTEIKWLVLAERTRDGRSDQPEVPARTGSTCSTACDYSDRGLYAEAAAG